MRIEVSKPVLTETRLCGNGFACLSGPDAKICKVRGHVVKGALVVECAGDVHCKYQLSFGTWSICSCPTRKEIFEQYAV